MNDSVWANMPVCVCGWVGSSRSSSGLVDAKVHKMEIVKRSQRILFSEIRGSVGVAAMR